MLAPSASGRAGKVCSRIGSEAREQLAARVVDAPPRASWAVAQQLEVFLGDSRVVEGERRGRSPAEQLRLRVQVGDPAAVVELQVVGDHGGDRHQQRGQGRGQHQAEQLLLDGGWADHDDPATTLRATASSRALMRSCPRSAGGSATSKRTLSSLDDEVDHASLRRARSRTRSRRAASGLSRRRRSPASRGVSCCPTNSTWSPASGSPRRSLRTATARPCTVRPVVDLLELGGDRVGAEHSDGERVSGRAKAAAGHSTKPPNL